MSKAVFIPPTAKFKPGQRVYIQSLYGEEDVPGRWTCVGLADGQHTTETMYRVRQLEPLLYPIEEGLVTEGRLFPEPWSKQRAAIRRATKNSQKARNA